MVGAVHGHSLKFSAKNYFTSDVSAGFNSCIQSIKIAARGFRNFANYRTRILFFCGKLDLSQTIPSH
ncbi:MAG: transposase [Pirellulaceae bacterium]|nr:transposase [Pirellulaceae bacterium]